MWQKKVTLAVDLYPTQTHSLQGTAVANQQQFRILYNQSSTFIIVDTKEKRRPGK